MADPLATGSALLSLVSELYPICRSITGAGIRETLRRIQEIVPLELHDVPSGTAVFDWTVPNEWNIRDACIADASGRRLVDFQRHNLHVVNYSTPIDARMTLAELRPHLHTVPAQPTVIPYRTSYYAPTWGFCLAHNDLAQFSDDAEYQVRIDSTLQPGRLTYGELLLPGESTDEFLFSTHCCHPSLANDNLSGIAVATALAQTLMQRDRRYSYRFLFIPGTIGSITWLAQNGEAARRIKHGLVLSCLGDAGRLTYKRSRRGNAAIDRAAETVLAQVDHEINDFIPYGYDERQYCSPGFNLAVGCLTRTPNGRYPEYHTSADNLEFVKAHALQDSLETVLRIIEQVEQHDTAEPAPVQQRAPRGARYLNLLPKCEPQLGKRGLYSPMGGHADLAQYQMALLWLLNLSDGEHGIVDIAERSGIGEPLLGKAAAALLKGGLLQPLPDVVKPAVS